MANWLIRGILTVVLAAVATAAGAQSDAPLRLKARTFVPPANVHAAERARPWSREAADAARRHVIIQFAGRITGADISDLRRAGGIPLRYVPDNAVSAAVPPGFDPAALPRARWIGELEPGDRMSQATAADIARDQPRFPLTVVEFHPDVTPAELADRLAFAGAGAVGASGLLAHQAVVATEPVVLARLAADDGVAWMYPATTEVLTARLICQGVLSSDGVVAEYATVGDGWDGPGRGGADLGFLVTVPTVDIAASTTRAEVARALMEWSRYIDVTWQQAARADAARSLTIFWGPTDHGDAYPFEPSVLAHAFYNAPVVSEPLAGDVHFNEAFPWAAGDPSYYDVFSVMLHEAGHTLGLGHSDDPNGVMYPTYRGIVPGLSPSDVAAAQSLYANAGTPLDAAWSAEDIGVSMPGGASSDAARFTIEATGQDIWGSVDELRFVSRPLEGDGDIVARLDSLAAVHRWTKAGVMIRQSTAAGSPHAFMLVSGEKGLAFQRRRTAGGLSTSTDGGAGTAPRWLWLSRRGDRFEAYAAVDGGAWKLIGSDTIAMGASVLAGLALTSHDPLAVATAVFSSVGATAPPLWRGLDIGNVGVPGSLALTSTQVRVAGAGQDIWGTADAFHFAWQTLNGDGEIVARVASVQNINAWVKAGVMIRASLDASAPHGFMLVSAAKGYAFQRRLAFGGISYHTAGGSGAAPQWVKLRRQGTLITASRSADGMSWTTVGSATIAMNPTVYIGLAVSSHIRDTAALAVFDNVSVR